MTYISTVKDGLELVIDSETGEVFASVSGAARLCGVSRQTIHKFKTCNQMTLKTAETLTSTGFKTCNLFTEDLLVKLMARYNPDVLAEFAMLGMRLALHKLVGWERPEQKEAAKVFDVSEDDEVD